MRKHYLLLLSALVAGTGQTLFAGPVSSGDALEIARDFYMSKLAVSGKMMKAVADLDFKVAFDSNIIPSDGVKRVKSESAPTYYVVSPGENLGYVVVSGDDETTQVLGYSLSGSVVSSDNLAPEMKYWLDCYDDEISYLRSNTARYGMRIYESPSVEYTKAYDPLLVDIKWNQDDPYNSQCPMMNGKRTYVGCLATAIGQIMRYYKWPLKGKGSISYTTAGGIKVSADFEDGEYDWDNMLPTYDSSASQAQRDAVGKLLFHVGAASKMEYTTEASAASNSSLAPALINNFSYSKNLRIITRNATSLDEWLAVIQKELAERRPVYYTGVGTGGGHAFVLDGYDGNGMYHFNWGWSGVSDGYFALSVLDPMSQGIGGNTSNFNYMQEILVGIMPQTDNEPAGTHPNLCVIHKPSDNPVATEGIMSSTSEASVNELVYISGGVLNNGISDYNGTLYLMMYNDQKEYPLGMADLSLVHVTYMKASFPVMFGSRFPDGKYQMCFGYYDDITGDGEDEFVKMGSYYAQAPSRLNVEINNGTVTITSPGNADLSASVVSVPERIYKGRQAKFKINFTNNGNSYDSALGVVIIDKNDESRYQYAGLYQNVFIGSNESLEVEVAGRINLKAGEYYVYPMYDQVINYINPSCALVPGSEPVSITIEDEPDDENLSLTDIDGSNSINIESGNGGVSDFKVALKNEGGYYAGRIKVGVKGKSTGIFAIGYIEIGTGETKTVDVSGELSLAPGTYTAVVYYEDAGINNTSFVRLDGGYTLNVTEYHSTSIDDTDAEKISVYPNPVSENLFIESLSGIDRLEFYNTDGKLAGIYGSSSVTTSIDMSGYPRGLYFVKVYTADKVYVYRIVKK